MRCPKCGYNSFDYLDSCKKCGKDLAEHKQRFGIVSVLFPGQMASPGALPSEADDSIAEEVVAAAATAAPEAVAEEQAVNEAADSAEDSNEGDDFGFDFMGDSEEEEDLSFDELFEEASADEDVEETLPSPEQEGGAASGDDFSFDVDSDSEVAGGGDELEDDFGFDPGGEIEEPIEDDLSFEPDTVNFDDEEEGAGAKEDPKDPFELPESSQDEEAPESDSITTPHSLDTETEVADIEEDDFLSAEVRSEASSLSLDEYLQDDEDSLQGDFFPPPQPVEDAAVTPAGEDELLEGNGTVALSTPQTEMGEPGAVAAATAVSVAAIGAVAGESEEPESIVENAEEDVDPLLPATGTRVVAFACDLTLLLFVAISFLIAAEAAISPAGGLLPTFESLLALSIPYFLVLFSLAFGYFTLFHFLAGQTPGKMLAGLRVESANGESLLFSQAFLRSVGGLLQLLPFGLGYLAILTSAERRGWNDRLAGTRLISLKAIAEDG